MDAARNGPAPWSRLKIATLMACMLTGLVLALGFDMSESHPNLIPQSMILGFLLVGIISLAEWAGKAQPQ
jgi:hypothetical protein